MSDPDSVSVDFSFKDLQAFISVATTGSFRRAAHQLFTSQPAVSRSIARLETGLGTRLLDRGARGATITPVGRSFVERARKILAAVQDTRAEARNGWTASIHLGAAATAAGSYLAPFLAEWIPAHPEIRLQVLEDGAARLRKRLDDGECDLAIIAAPVPVHLEARPLTRVGIRAHFPRRHPLGQSSDALSLGELAPHRLLLNDLPFLSAEVLLAAFESSGLRPHVVYQSSSGHTLAALAEAGMGVAVFGDSVDHRGRALLSRPVVDGNREQLGFDLHIAWPKKETPEFIRDFGIALSRFSRRRDSVIRPE